MSPTLLIIISTVVAFVAVNWSYFKTLRIAKDKQIVDNPNARKLQKTPVPILGGIAVFFGIVAGTLARVAIMKAFGVATTANLLPVMCAMVLMIYTGAMDDVIGLSPKSRFIIEILTILGVIFASGQCIDSFHGLWGVESFNWWWAVPLTVVASVGIINAINMIDGVNGLSSGLCISCNIVFGIAFFRSGDMSNALLAFVVAAALLPFLIHNVFGNKSRMFIGDAGTMAMGLLMSWFVISLLSKDSLFVPERNGNAACVVAFALATLSVPVFDTLRVMFMRILHGKSPFNPDKTHLHHVFVRMGVSHSITAFTEIVLDLLIVGVWLLTVKQGVSLDWQLYVVIAVSVVLVWGLYFFLHWHEEHHTEFMHRLAHLGIKTHLGYTQWWQSLERWLDGPENRAEVSVEIVKPLMGLEEFYHFDAIDPDNLKEQDRKRMFDFMKGKAEVFVDDIKKRSGAHPLRVDALIQEGISDGFIIQIKDGVWGTPLIVTLTEENQ